MMNYSGENTIVKERFKLVNHLPNIGIDHIKKEIISGLQSAPKYISPKYFYDEEGSKLFEKITQLQEYYPTRTEKSILSTIYLKLGVDFSNLNIIELGSGDHSKISLLLKQIPNYLLRSITYYPMDISQSAIESSSTYLQQKFPDLHISGIVADFIHQLTSLSFKGKNLFCFLGSTIGNLSPNEVKIFMRDLSSTMNTKDHLLIGMDLVKDIHILENAYNDNKEITSAFNKNILNVVNNIIGSNFNINNFSHHAFYNSSHQRIEMHLIANKHMIVDIPKHRISISLAMGETILTEYSYKFQRSSIEKIGSYGELKLKKIHTDDKEWFNLVHFVKE